MDERQEAYLLEILMSLLAAGADAKRLRMELADPRSGLSDWVEDSNEPKLAEIYVRGFIAGFEAAEGRANG